MMEGVNSKKMTISAILATAVYGRVTAIIVSGTATIESVLTAVANFI
jgi:hypothetical protein